MISDKENKELASMMRPQQTDKDEKRWRENGAYLVVFFGMLSYKVIWTSEADKTGDPEASAKRECEWWQAHARRGRLWVPSYTTNAVPHDFDVRTQADLDALTRAILDSYNY